MKKLYTFCLGLLAVSAVAQVPTNLGCNAEDGFTYVGFNLIDHGVVSSVRFMAQNSIPAGGASWEFFTGDYMNNWRPYTPDDTVSGYNAIIDPAVETASARYNSNYGGSTGKLQAIQAGYYYTFIVQDGTGDNKMSIIETDFAPVILNSIVLSPADPLVSDDLIFTVELLNALTPSVGEHVFVRASVNNWVTSFFVEVTNFSNGVGSITVPAGSIPAGITVEYYALVTAEATPQHSTIDYFTLYFGNNGGANYSFTISEVTGVEQLTAEYGIQRSEGSITISRTNELERVELISMDGKLLASQSANGVSVNLATNGLPSGIYALNLIGTQGRKTLKLLVD